MGEKLFVGQAELVITPPLGVSISGYYHDRRADDIADDLYARAVVISDGENKLAVVVCDVISLDREVTAVIRADIQSRTGIPVEQIMICCTHTHTGPMTDDWPSAEMYADPDYMALLKRKVADAVFLAERRLGPAQALVGHGEVHGVAFNRRFWMKDGTIRTNPNFQDPNIVRRAGPIDPDLGLLMFQTLTGDPLALISNFAVHPDQIGGTAISADYEGAEARILKQVLGETCAVLVPNGCCGDLNHYDFFRPGEEQRQGVAAANRSGQAIAGEAIKQLPRMKVVENPVIKTAQTEIPIYMRVPTTAELEWAREKANDEMTGFSPEGLEVVKAHRMLEIEALGCGDIPAEVIAFAIGDVAIVGLPGEMFVELGLEIKERSPFAHTMIYELCNDCVGYVLTAKAYDEGGYEATSCHFQPDSGPRLVECALELLGELKRS